MSYTLAHLPVSKATYDEIAAKLRDVDGYELAIDVDGSIDMTGLALVLERDPVHDELAAAVDEVLDVDEAARGGT